MDVVVLEKIESSILNSLGYIGRLKKKNGNKGRDKTDWPIQLDLIE